MALQKAIAKEKKSFFREKIQKNANNSQKLWKALKSLEIKSGKANQSKIALKMMLLFNLNIRKMQIFLKISTLI